MLGHDNACEKVLKTDQKALTEKVDYRDVPNINHTLEV